jgi:hypothetical protein
LPAPLVGVLAGWCALACGCNGVFPLSFSWGGALISSYRFCFYCSGGGCFACLV